MYNKIIKQTIMSDYVHLFNSTSERELYEASDNYVEPYISAIDNTKDAEYNKINNKIYKVRYNGTEENMHDFAYYQYDSEVEYLESTGTQYILNIPVPTIKNVTQWEINMKINVTRNFSYNNIFSLGSGQTFECWFTGKLLFRQNTNNMSMGIDTAYLNVGQTRTVKIKWDNSKVYIYIDGTLRNSRKNTAPTNEVTNLRLFTRATAATNNSEFKLWYFNFTIQNQLILDMIPVRLNNKGYLYNKVNDTLYGNTGNGEFLFGQDKLPYDAEIEYLESTGTQYIDTGINGYMNHNYEIDFQQTVAGNYAIWGVNGQASYIGYNMSLVYGTISGSSKWMQRWESESGKQRYVSSTITIDTNRHSAKILNGLFYFDEVYRGQSTGHDSSFSINYHTYLFTLNRADQSIGTIAKAKIYSYKESNEANKLIRDFIPVRVGQTGYMYDKVSGKLFGNIGTGSFILGPDV